MLSLIPTSTARIFRSPPSYRIGSFGATARNTSLVMSTEAASSLGLYLSKSVTFERFGALTPDVAVKGLIAGASLMSGAFIAKRFVLQLEPDAFRLIMDAIMIAAGLAMLWTAATT